MSDATERPGSSDGPKVIVDEDWKAQAQAEKERLAHEAGQAAATKGASAAATTKSAGAARERQLPPATFDVLINTLATQALLGLGRVANPITGQREIKLDEARHFIDMLSMLEAKTTGNRTPEESRLVEAVLHELRMSYVTVQSQSA